jgi:hypothetical protein
MKLVYLLELGIMCREQCDTMTGRYLSNRSINRLYHLIRKYRFITAGIPDIFHPCSGSRARTICKMVRMGLDGHLKIDGMGVGCPHAPSPLFI